MKNKTITHLSWTDYFLAQAKNFTETFKNIPTVINKTASELNTLGVKNRSIDFAKLNEDTEFSGENTEFSGEDTEFSGENILTTPAFEIIHPPSLEKGLKEKYEKIIAEIIKKDTGPTLEELFYSPNAGKAVTIDLDDLIAKGKKIDFETLFGTSDYIDNPLSWQSKNSDKDSKIKKRSVDSNNQNPYSILQLDESDEAFIKEQYHSTYTAPLSSNDLYFNYVVLAKVINDLNIQAEEYDKEFPYVIYTMIVAMTQRLVNITILLKQFSFMVEDDQGRLGLPRKKTIGLFTDDYNHAIEHMLKTFPDIMRTLNISVNILKKFTLNHKELFKNSFGKFTEAYQPKPLAQGVGVITQILSYFKAFNAITENDLDKFIDRYAIFDKEAGSEYFLFLGKKFYYKEALKNCFQNMNNNILSKKIGNLDFHKEVKSLESNISPLTETYEKILPQYNNKAVKANKKINQFSILERDAIDKQRYLYQIPNFKLDCERLPQQNIGHLNNNYSDIANKALPACLGLLSVPAIFMLWKYLYGYKKMDNNPDKIENDLEDLKIEESNFNQKTPLCSPASTNKKDKGNWQSFKDKFKSKSESKIAVQV